MTEYALLCGKVIEITEDGTQLALTPDQIVERLRDRVELRRRMLAAAAAIASPENYENIKDTLWMPGNCPQTIFDYLDGDSDAAEIIALAAGAEERAQLRAAALAAPLTCDCACAECAAAEHPAESSTCGAPATMTLRRDDNSPGWNYCDGCGVECLESGLYQRDE